MTRETENLSGAYALDAVTDSERAAYEADLASDGGDLDAAAELAGFTAAAAHLAHLSATPPPASLRDAVLADIRRVRPLPPLAGDGSSAAATGNDTVGGPTDEPTDGPGDGPSGGPTEVPAGLASSRPPAPVVDLDRRRRLRRTFFSLVAAAALVAGVLVVNPWRPGNAPTGEPTMSRSVSAFEAVSAAADVTRYPVPIKGAVATVVLSRSLGKAVLVMNGLPTIPGTKDYQAWLQLPGRGLVSAGIMPHDPAATTWDLVGDASQATAFGITVEPTGGSTAPTTTPIALVELPTA